jgi:hypothetical protein
MECPVWFENCHGMGWKANADDEQHAQGTRGKQQWNRTGVGWFVVHSVA